VPVATVQLRFDGWVTELQNDGERQQLTHAAGIDNLLYTPDADFSCFADLALTSPGSFYEGQGSLLQLVLTPGDPFIKKSNEAIAQHVLGQVHELFPSSRQLNMTWYNVVKLCPVPLPKPLGWILIVPTKRRWLTSFLQVATARLHR